MEYIDLPKLNRPYFFTSFVSTIDGKVAIRKEGYWPIGSAKDYEHFTNLRAHADVIIDGRGTAMEFGKRTIDRLHDPVFQKQRKALGKTKQIEYIVLTSSADEELKKLLENPYGFQPKILLKEQVKEDFTGLIEYLHKQTHKFIFIDGGPQLLASLLKHDLIDEIFLTIAPKIFGSSEGVTSTLVEGQLFKPEEIKQFRLVSTQQQGDEIFLRYKMANAS